jgi:hypothetical protein
MESTMNTIDRFDLYDITEARVTHEGLTTLAAAEILLGLDGHVGELRQDSEGWWTVWQDGRHQRGLGSHPTELEAADAVLNFEWSGVEARTAHA